jgi:aromatic-L-amino-acid/L-tryptophan decarboxylase
VRQKSDPADLIPRFQGAPPELPGDFGQALGVLREHVLANTLHVDHPRFFGFVPGPGNYASVLADAIASGRCSGGTRSHRPADRWPI